MSNVFEQNFWVLVKPAEDVPGQWVGHCLDLDILSVGTSPRHALDMTGQAVCEIVADDLAHGRYPLDRHRAPPEFYSELARVQSKGSFVKLVKLDELPSDRPVIAAMQFHIRSVHFQLVESPSQRSGSDAEQQPSCVETVPAVWLMSAA